MCTISIQENYSENFNWMQADMPLLRPMKLMEGNMSSLRLAEQVNPVPNPEIAITVLHCLNKRGNWSQLPPL